MNIVLCNKYFFLNGGTEKYLKVLLQYLPDHGHRALPFSVRYAESWKSPYADYFLAPPASPSQTHLSKITVTPKNLFRLISRCIYSRAAQHALCRLLKEAGRVDIGYVLNIYNYMSPSIIDTFSQRSIPVVMHIGDYNLVCPAYTLLRDNKPCSLCIAGAYYHGVLHRCVKKNMAASIMRVLAMYIHKWIRIYDRVAAFVVPCRFMKEILMRGGFPDRKIHIIPYPLSKEDLPPRLPKHNYILYFGRLSPEKGIDTLIKAYQRCALQPDLVIAGRNYDNEEERLRKIILPTFRDRVHFIGFKEGDELSKLIGQALFSVVPSRWYDNAPLSVYESFAHYTPVVGSAIGGIPEQINDMVTGRLFRPDNVQELADAFIWMLADRNRLFAMAEAGRAFVEKNLNIDRHIHSLIALFSELQKQASVL